MLSIIRSAIPEGNRKYPLKYYRMMNSIMDHMSLAKNRYTLAHPIQTQGMELLRYLILNIPMSELDGFSNDFERYTNVIKFYKSSYLASFDPVVTGNVMGGKWIRRTGSVDQCEIILNTDIANPLDVYPFDEPWESWQNLRAVRLLYHNSYEMPEDFSKSLFDFKTEIPSVTTISLDVATLVFKYYKYCKACYDQKIEPLPNEFLKQYEYQHFFDDLYEIFVLNLLLLVYENPDMSVEDIASRHTIPARFCQDNILIQGIDGVKEYVALLQTNACKPQDFLDIRWFLGGSIKDKMNLLDAYCIVPERQNYLWTDVLKWMPYLRLIVAAANMFPDSPLGKLLMTRCNMIYRRKFQYAQIPSLVHGQVLRTFVYDLRNKIEALLKNEVSMS